MSFSVYTSKNSKMDISIFYSTLFSLYLGSDVRVDKIDIDNHMVRKIHFYMVLQIQVLFQYTPLYILGVGIECLSYW